MDCGGSWLKSSAAVPNERSRSSSVALDFLTLGDRPSEVVRNRGGADAAARADHGDDAAGERLVRVHIEPADRADEVERLHRRHDVFAHAAAHQLAEEGDIVDRADDDDLGAFLDHLRQAIQGVQHLLALHQRVEDQQVRAGLRRKARDRAVHAAGFNRDFRARHAAVRGDAAETMSAISGRSHAQRGW